VEIELEHGIESFEEFVELMFRMFWKDIIRYVGVYYRNEFEEIKKMDVRVILELFEKM
jgi:hypothetical protein